LPILLIGGRIQLALNGLGFHGNRISKVQSMLVALRYGGAA
jgi:hypothetical protein